MDENLTTNEHAPATRLSEIDGLRGWAALIVVLFHFIEEMFSHVEPSLKTPLLASILDGRLPVMIFFILSGDALSSAYFNKRDVSTVDRLLVKRYLRLTIPIFLSCLLVFILMRAGFVYHVEAARILHREEWLGQFLQIDTSVGRLIKYSFIDVYTAHALGKSFNPMLWTMSAEIVGSMMIFLTCYAWQRMRHPVVTVVAVAVLLMTLGSMYSLFFVGMALSHARRVGFLDQLRSAPPAKRLTWIAAAAAVVLNAVFWFYRVFIFFDMLLAVLVVVTVYSNNHMRAVFSNGFSRYLGDISFPLYLTHFSVLISVLSYGVVTTHRIHGEILLSNVYLWIICSLLLAFALATIFRLIEKRILLSTDKAVVGVLA